MLGWKKREWLFLQPGFPVGSFGSKNSLRVSAGFGGMAKALALVPCNSEEFVS